MSRPGLGGFTYSPQYSMTMIEWLEERHARKRARSDAVIREGESAEAFEARVAAMPKPRSWSDYTLDPLDDGVVLLDNPTEDENTRFYGIDPNADINRDALVVQPWWEGRMESGRNEEAISLYKGYIRDADISLTSKAAEIASPSVFVATGAGDTIPSAFNLFQTEKGGRVQAHKADKWYKRVGINMVQGPAGWLMIAVGTVVLAKTLSKVIPAAAETVTEVIDEGIVEPLKD